MNVDNMSLGGIHVTTKDLYYGKKYLILLHKHSVYRPVQIQIKKNWSISTSSFLRLTTILVNDRLKTNAWEKITLFFFSSSIGSDI